MTLNELKEIVANTELTMRFECSYKYNNEYIGETQEGIVFALEVKDYRLGMFAEMDSFTLCEGDYVMLSSEGLLAENGDRYLSWGEE